MEKSQFLDSPEETELSKTIEGWPKPAGPEVLAQLFRANGDFSFWKSAELIKEDLRNTAVPGKKVQLEKATLNWLYDFIRLNVKRGRIFDLLEVLETGRADCLGYAKLFTVLGIRWGLDLGVVEVVIDNRGQAVPHTATLVKLADGSPRFVDFWYGCRNIRHQRLALNVKRRGRWQVEDIDFPDIKNAQEIAYLPEYCVDAVTLYIRGNRSLKQEDYAGAIQQYTESIQLYPENARVYYNRAIAYEKMGETGKAEADYRRALRDDNSIIRTLATSLRTWWTLSVWMKKIGRSQSSRNIWPVTDSWRDVTTVLNSNKITT